MSIENTIRDLITENVEGFDGQMLVRDAKFTDTGLDSLDMATVFLEVQEIFDVVLADGDEEEYDTLEKLVAYIEASKC